MSSALLGFFTGILPGAGATPASFMSYGLAQKLSRHPERFGNGAVEGVMAPEAANNAAGTGSILPMLVLGIPGSPTAAILMAGVFMWGFIPGPRLLHDAPELVWGFIASLYVANVIAFVICLLATPLLASVLRVPYALLAPLIVVLSIVGAYAIQNSMLDVMLVLIFGVIGFILRKLDYPLAPLIVALVLGMPDGAHAAAEPHHERRLAVGLLQRSLALPLMMVAMLLFFLPLIRLLVQRLR
jgi:putative tricarboxylic transport membrane protein